VIPARELAGVLDNIGIPSGSIPLTYLDNGVTGTSDADILVSLNRDHRPTDDYVRRLRTRLGRDFTGSTFYFLPADIMNQTINFGLPAPIDIQVMGRDREKSRQNWRITSAKFRTPWMYVSSSRPTSPNCTLPSTGPRLPRSD
jgi:hypothetical protein